MVGVSVSTPVNVSAEDWLLQPDLGPDGRPLPMPRRPRRFMAYHRLIAGMLVANAVVLVLGLTSWNWRTDDGSALEALSALTIVNFTVAVLVRQAVLLNLLFSLAGRGRRSWPLWLRWSVSKVNHVGGLHVGGALAGTGWLLAFCVTALGAAGVDGTTRVLAIVLSLQALTIVLGAMPVVRARWHNVFENTHRWGGWSAIAVFWVLLVHTAEATRGDESLLSALAGTWQVWVLVVLTASVAAPWVKLRKVPISVERPSKHAAIVTFDYGVTPGRTTAVGVSRSPLREWHAFATVTRPGRTGYRILISRAGDWTSAFIDDPPTHLWVRGTPVSAPMAKVAMLYERCIYLVTGSAIGPCLGQILANEVPARLVWSTRNPRRTYGDALVDEVLAVQPDALIWDTTERGPCDLVALARQAYHEFDAQAVFVVSNKAATLNLCARLERAGIPAIGPIWDS